MVGAQEERLKVYMGRLADGQRDWVLEGAALLSLTIRVPAVDVSAPADVVVVVAAAAFSWLTLVWV